MHRYLIACLLFLIMQILGYGTSAMLTKTHFQLVATSQIMISPIEEYAVTSKLECAVLSLKKENYGFGYRKHSAPNCIIPNGAIRLENAQSSPVNYSIYLTDHAFGFAPEQSAAVDLATTGTVVFQEAFPADGHIQEIELYIGSANREFSIAIMTKVAESPKCGTFKHASSSQRFVATHVGYLKITIPDSSLSFTKNHYYALSWHNYGVVSFKNSPRVPYCQVFPGPTTVGSSYIADTFAGDREYSLRVLVHFNGI